MELNTNHKRFAIENFFQLLNREDPFTAWGYALSLAKTLKTGDKQKILKKLHAYYVDVFNTKLENVPNTLPKSKDEYPKINLRQLQYFYTSHALRDEGSTIYILEIREYITVREIRERFKALLIEFTLIGFDIAQRGEINLEGIVDDNTI